LEQFFLTRSLVGFVSPEITILRGKLMT